MGKSKAPEYPTVKTDTGLFGTTITKGKGSTFKPTDLQKELVGLTDNYAVSSLNNYLNPDYESEDYLRGEEYYRNKLNNKLENDYLSPMLSRNLLRGSTSSDLLRGFANDLANTEYERQNDYKNQQLQNYMAAMLPYTTVYDMMKGTTGLSNALANSVGQYNLQKTQLDNQSSGLGSLLGGLGSLASGVGNLYGSRK